MRGSWTTVALLTFALAGEVLAQEHPVDTGYRSEHEGWKTSCAETLADRHGQSCLVERLDEASGMSLLLVTFPLHDELVGADGGGRMTERQFHDAVLEQNSIPVEMIRAALTGETLTRDWTPSWRFAGEVGAGDASAPAAAAPAPH